MNSRVIIIVPVYKENLTQYEEISLKQLITVLGHYDICLIAPDGFVPKYKELIDCKYSIEYFDRKGFESVKAYSDLLLNKEFYTRFSIFSHMLIYQLDCFVFRDDLQEFCEMGYDYIGSSIYQEEGFWSKYHVGNGGLSLRKIDKSIRVLDYYDDVRKCFPYPEQLDNSEDVFFSFCGANDRYDFVSAPAEIADRFSLFVDTEEKKKKIIKNGLPFGIHYFPTYYKDFWKPFIQLYGYEWPVKNADDKNRKYLALMNQWMILKEEKKGIINYMENKGYFKVAIYGASVYARHMIRELNKSKITILYCIDKSNRKPFMDIKCIKPTDKLDYVDAIINTVIWDHESIYKQLEKKIDCPIVSLEDIIFDSYWY